MSAPVPKRRICRRCPGEQLLIQCSHSRNSRAQAPGSGVNPAPAASFHPNTGGAPTPQLPQPQSAAYQFNPVQLQQMAQLVSSFGAPGLSTAMGLSALMANNSPPVPPHQSPIVAALPSNAFGVDLAMLLGASGGTPGSGSPPVAAPPTPPSASTVAPQPSAPPVAPPVAAPPIASPSTVTPPTTVTATTVTATTVTAPPSAPPVAAPPIASPSTVTPPTTVTAPTIAPPVAAPVAPPPTVAAPASAAPSSFAAPPTDPSSVPSILSSPAPFDLSLPQISAPATPTGEPPKAGKKRPLPSSASSDSGRPNKRLFPSGARPIFDWIEGVGRGKRSLKMARKRAMQPRILEQVQASKNYTTWVHDLMTRCESISVRTGCWMYVAVQHPASRTPFIHYSSPKLRREAPAALESFHKEVSLTMTALVRSDRKAKVEEALSALKQEARAVAAESRSERMEVELNAARDRVAELEAKLTLLTVTKDDDGLFPDEDEEEDLAFLSTEAVSDSM